MDTKEIKLSKSAARKVAQSINGALCSGAGNGEGQNVCIMQAIARALGLPANDDQVSECVGKRENDTLLRLTAEVGLEVLTEMKSPGVKWLNVLDEVEAA